jgi:hypothetical protein
MDIDAYMRMVASTLADELRLILKLPEVTANSNLLGPYTEACVRRLVRRIVHPMRVCSGAILHHPIEKRQKQIDLIIWAPFPAPALFDVEGFGLGSPEQCVRSY